MKNLTLTFSALLSLSFHLPAFSDSTTLTSFQAAAEKSQTTEVRSDQGSHMLIFRQSSLQASLADVRLAEDDHYFSALGQNEYTQFAVEPGFKTFRAKAVGSVSSKMNISVAENETVCVEARPNHEDLYLLVIPFLNALVPSFKLVEVACPSETELAALTQI